MLVRRALLAALVLAIPAFAAADSPAVRDLVAKGVRLTNQGDAHGARAVWAQLRELDPTHPAAPVFDIYTLFSLQVADENDTSYDAEIAEMAERAIDLAEARVERNGDDADARFYLGQAYFHRARLEGIRGRAYPAGRDAERARKQLETTLRLQPSLVDAKLPIGMYYYYAGLLPQFVKWFRWLWFIPRGESATGLRYLEEVYAHNGLFGPDAAFFLMNIHTFHDPDYGRALEIGAGLRERFPANFLLANEYVDLLLEACRYEEAAGVATLMEDTPARGARDTFLQRMIRVSRARAELLQGRPERASVLLEDFGPEGPERPYWGSAWVFLTRAQAFDAQQQRARALGEYERVTALEKPRGSRRATHLAERGLETAFDPAAQKCGAPAAK